MIFLPITMKNLIKNLAINIVRAIVAPIAVVLTVVLWVWVPLAMVVEAMRKVHQRVSAWTADQLVVWAIYIEE